MTIKTIVALAASPNWHVFQFYVNNAFLIGDFNEEVHTRIHHEIGSNRKVKENMYTSYINPHIDCNKY